MMLLFGNLLGSEEAHALILSLISFVTIISLVRMMFSLFITQNEHSIVAFASIMSFISLAFGNLREILSPISDF